MHVDDRLDTLHCTLCMPQAGDKVCNDKKAYRQVSPCNCLPAIKKGQRREAGLAVKVCPASFAVCQAARIDQLALVEEGRGPHCDGRVHAVLLRQQSQRVASLQTVQAHCKVRCSLEI